MADYILYNNQGATRNRPLDDDLVKRLKYLQDMGITMQVFSGGQPDKDEGGARVGSVRHDHGGAADAFFFKDGRKLDWANPDDLPIFQQIVSQGKANGVTGFGAGPGYMQEGSMHIGMGTPGVWGAGGKSDTAPSWLKAAYDGAKFDPVAEVLAAADPNAVTGPLGTSSAASSAPPVAGSTIANPNAGKPYHDGFLSFLDRNTKDAAVQPATVTVGADGKPESRGLLEKLGMGKMPESLLGIDTNKSLNTFGALAKLMGDQTAAQNQQQQATAQSAQSRRGSAPPVEIQAAPSSVLAGTGGLGGMTPQQQDELKKKMLLAQLGLTGMGGRFG